ncbi:unnamed protein product [Closterium sp. NIES-54]
MGGVQPPALLTSAVAGAENVGAGTSTPTSLTPSVPPGLTTAKLLGGQGLTTALLLLALTATGATPLRRAATSSTAASATSVTSAAYANSAPSATATAASTAAADTSTPATTPTTTPTPSTATTTTSTTLASPTSALAPLAPAGAASPARGRRSSDRLETTEVGRSSRSNRGQEGGGGTPLKDRGARVTTRGSYSDYARLYCEEALLEEVNAYEFDNDAILVVIDKFSKMGHFIPTHTTARTEETTQLFFRYVISQHGIPTTLISDRDPKFTSKFWKELMSLMGTKLAVSSAYHPLTDGQTERLNQIVEQLLRAACKDDISKWDAHLPVIEFAYNNATHTATGQTPFFLCYGRNPLTPQKPTVPATVQPAHDFITTMHHLWERTHKRLLTIQQHQKKLADRIRTDHSIKIGDQVLLDTRNLESSHLPSKLRPRFCGPFLVEAQVTPVTFRLRLPATWRIHNAFHVQLLKPYRDPNTVFKGRQPPPPLLDIVNGEPEYEVEAVLAHRRRRNGTLELLIRWKGYDPSEDSWVPEHDMDNARRPLHDYLVKQGVTSTTQL